MADVLKGLDLLGTLKESMDSNKLSEVKDAVEDLLLSRINLGILGERSPEKYTFMNSLRGLAPGDEGAAPSPALDLPGDIEVYPDPKHQDFRLWDLRPVPTAPASDMDGFMEQVKFLRYNAVLLTSTETPEANAVELLSDARSLQRQNVYLVLFCSAKDTEEEAELRRRASEEELATRGFTQPKVYWVSPANLERHDFPGLVEDMSKDLPEIRSQALILALPALTPGLIAQKKEAFKAVVWAAASLSGGVSTLPLPFVASMVDASVAVRILARAQASLCLDDASLEQLARRVGRDAAALKGQRSCALSVEVTKAEVKRRLAAAEKELATFPSRLVEMAMPRHARYASRSFAAMMSALNAAIEEMAADAERIQMSTQA